MKKKLYELIDIKKIVLDIDFASLNQHSFSKFICESELNSTDDNLSEECLIYSNIWFDLEIINALALSDWEDENYPSDWQNSWNIKYKKDAEILLLQLKNHLCQLTP